MKISQFRSCYGPTFSFSRSRERIRASGRHSRSRRSRSSVQQRLWGLRPLSGLSACFVVVLPMYGEFRQFWGIFRNSESKQKRENDYGLGSVGRHVSECNVKLLHNYECCYIIFSAGGLSISCGHPLIKKKNNLSFIHRRPYNRLIQLLSTQSALTN